MEIIKNGKVFTKNFTFEKADIILDKGEIKDIIQVILAVVQMQITINQIIITLELSMLMA